MLWFGERPVLYDNDKKALVEIVFHKFTGWLFVFRTNNQLFFALPNCAETQKTLFFAHNRHCRTINAVLSVIVAEPAEKCRDCIMKHYSTVKLSVNCG